jgi:hypothetical protein
MQQARGVGEEGGGGGEAGEQQIRALGNPYSSFSSSSSSLCILRGFDKRFCFRLRRTIMHVGGSPFSKNASCKFSTCRSVPGY